jgi:hypothetical protein
MGLIMVPSPIDGNIQAFQLSNGLLSTAPTSRSAGTYTYPGGTLAISANGTTNGILWAVQRNGTTSPGVLFAYDPANLANLLYNSSQAGSRDTMDVAAKFSIPLVANGKVFVVGVSQLTVYGLLPSGSRLRAAGPGFKSTGGTRAPVAAASAKPGLVQAVSSAPVGKLIPGKQLLAAPANLTTAPSANPCIVSWTAPAEYLWATGYMMEHRDPGSASFVQIGAATDATYNNTGPVNTGYISLIMASNPANNLSSYVFGHGPFSCREVYRKNGNRTFAGGRAAPCSGRGLNQKEIARVHALA